MYFVWEKISNTTIVCVPFKLLLEQLCAALSLPKSVYIPLSVGNGSGYVIVQTASAPSAYIFHGEEGEGENTLEDSIENAVQKMFSFLVKEYKIVVNDINLELREQTERICEMFKCKRKQYEMIERGLQCLHINDITPAASNGEQTHYISVDFAALLGIVIERLNIPVTPVEYMQFGESDYVAWVIIGCTRNYCPFHCITGNQKKSMIEAKQSPCRDATLFLMPLYNFYVEDVTYHLLQLSCLSTKLHRERYIAIKERVYGCKENTMFRTALAPR